MYVLFDKVGHVDNACHGQEGYGGDFFYMYSVLLTHLHVAPPFDKFIMRDLCTLNVVPTQLHPNAWATLQAFRILYKV